MIHLAPAFSSTWISHVPKGMKDIPMNDMCGHHTCHKHLSSSAQK